MNNKDSEHLIMAEDIVGTEWAEWYSLSPLERLKESTKLWQFYLAVGGSLDPEPDTQSPFYFSDEESQNVTNGRTGLHFLRSSRIQS